MTTRTLALLAALTAGPAAGEPALRLCAFDSEQSGGWVQPVIQIAHDAATGEVEVLDALILEHAGGPIEGSARARGDGTTIYHWVIRNVRDAAGNKISRIRYELVIRAEDGAATGRARPPPGFVGVYSAPGRCRAQE